MNIIKEITVTEDVTLISLADSPADISVIAKIFDMIARAGIDVDMISQTPPVGHHSRLSFSVKDDDFGGILETAAELRKIIPELKINVSSGNCKISIFGDGMRDCPGVAAKVFAAAALADADIRMITTSETDISLLVVKPDVDAVVSKIKASF